MTQLFRPDAIAVSSRTGQGSQGFLQYSSWDMGTMREFLIKYVEENHGGDFNDFVDSNYGMMLIDVMAYASDLLSFKLDVLLNESYMPTARQRRSVAQLAKMLGYSPRGRTAATAGMTLSVSAAYPSDVVVSPGTKITVPSTEPGSGGSLTFELYAENDEGAADTSSNIIIPAGRTFTSSVIAVEGATRSQDYQSTGDPGMRLRIDQVDVVESWISVFVEGDEWERVDYFLGALKEFAVDQDPDGAWVVYFGDGSDGLLPPIGTTVTVRYRIGGGTRGNIVRGYINQTINASLRGSAGNAPMTVYNHAKASGGAEAQTAEEIRTAASAFFKSHDRAVTAGDYVALAENYLDRTFGRIAKAACAVRRAGCSANVIDLYVIGVRGSSDLTAVDDAMKSSLAIYLEDKKCMTHRLCVRDAVPVRYSLSCIVSARRGSSRGSLEVEASARAQLERDLSTTWSKIGVGVRKSDIVRSISKLAGVEFIDADFTVDPTRSVPPSGDVSVEYWEIPQLDQVSVSVNMV